MKQPTDEAIVSNIQAAITALESEIHELAEAKKARKAELRQYRKALKAINGGAGRPLAGKGVTTDRAE